MSNTSMQHGRHSWNGARRLAIRAMLVALALSGVQPAMAIEEPAFTTTLVDREFSVRDYAPRIVAETDTAGSLSEASNAGFRRIAGYIFGGNRSRTADGTVRVAMTAPVTVEAQSARIAMTAPVTVEPGDNRWRVEFTMPAAYSLATLPVPLDPNVRLREVPAARLAVLRFSGLVGDAALAAQTTRLRAWMAGRGLTASGPPRLARYNPPWTLPFLRRNEILIPCH